MTSNTPASESNTDRVAFGANLRSRREKRDLTLDEIATTTRIPVRSLRALEAGEFSSLPADVFVRGFLRSYSKCVGLDPDATVQRYAGLGFDAAPVASEMADEVLDQLKEIEEQATAPVKPRRRMARGTSDWLARVKQKRAVAKPAAPVEERETEEVARPRAHEPQQKARTPVPAEESRRPRIFMPRDFSAEEEVDGRRGNLTFAVLILVIVATITMSYLMRRPSHAGDGISQVPAELVPASFDKLASFDRSVDRSA